MIERVEVRNFKSLGEISLPLGKFNCLIDQEAQSCQWQQCKYEGQC